MLTFGVGRSCADMHTILCFSRLYSYYACITVGCGSNPARQVSIGAGIPKEVPATTINMLCGSGLKSVVLGYQAIKCGDAAIVVAGGEESMSQV